MAPRMLATLKPPDDAGDAPSPPQPTLAQTFPPRRALHSRHRAGDVGRAKRALVLPAARHVADALAISRRCGFREAPGRDRLCARARQHLGLRQGSGAHVRHAARTTAESSAPRRTASFSATATSSRQFGDTKANDPVYSVAKSFLSTVAGVAVERGLIKNVNDPVAQYIHDGGYDSPHNAQDHLEEPPPAGERVGRHAVGQERGLRRTRAVRRRRAQAARDPGARARSTSTTTSASTASRCRCCACSAPPLPDVLKTAIMDPIGASHDWRWVPYDNSQVEINGKQIGSVSGGTRWGGGLWINSEDLARFGLLVLNHGNWNDKQLVSGAVAQGRDDAERARSRLRLPVVAEHASSKQWPSGPASSFAALGNGSNIDLDRSRPRHRVRLALVREPRDGRDDSAHRGRNHGAALIAAAAAC